jgi:hypothetical protein
MLKYFDEKYDRRELSVRGYNSNTNSNGNYFQNGDYNSNNNNYGKTVQNGKNSIPVNI